MLDDLGTPFRALAGYIFGGNVKREGSTGAAQQATGASEKVAMTAPVLMSEVVQPAAASAGASGSNEKVAMTSPVILSEYGSADMLGETVKMVRMVGAGSLPTRIQYSNASPRSLTFAVLHHALSIRHPRSPPDPEGRKGPSRRGARPQSGCLMRGVSCPHGCINK